MINLALIGVGKWGKNYLSTIENISDCQIGYTRTHDYQDLLSKTDVDGVIIATPGSTHFEIASQFLSNGFNLIIEKPLTTNLEEAEKLLHLWNVKKPKVLVGITYLYHESYRRLKSELMELGKIRSMEFEGLSSPIRDDISVLWDWGPHAMSMFLSLVKSPITEIKAEGQQDRASLELEFEGGIRAKAKMAWVNPEKIRTLKVVGSNKEVTIDFSQQESELPLTREVKEFIGAIKDNTSITSDLKFGVEVTRILAEAETHLNH